MFKFSFCALLLLTTATCFANPILKDDHFRTYIKNIESQLDNTVKPCESFGKYACGNLKTKTIDSPETDVVEKLIEKYLSDNSKPQTDAEKLFKTFYLSCKNNADYKAIFEQIDVIKSVKVWPVKRDFSDTEIAKLFGYFSTIEQFGFFDVDIMALAQNNVLSIITRSTFRSDDVANKLEKFGLSEEENIKTVERLTKFHEEIEKISNDEGNEVQFDEVKSVGALKGAIPNFDWHTYFTTYANAFNFNVDDFLNKTVKIQNLEKLKKIVNFVKETDSKTVADYIIWKYTEMSSEIKCETVIDFFFPFLSYKLMNGKKFKENDPENYFMNELEVFNNFEKSFTKIHSQFNNLEASELKDFMIAKKRGYENYGKFVSGQFFVELFSEFEMNEKTLYSNLIHMIQVLNKDLIVNGEDGNAVIFKEFLSPAFKKYISLDSGALPLMYNFIEGNTNLWKTAILLDGIYENRTINDDCLPYENKTDNYQNQRYLNIHAAHHIALQDYLNYVDEHKYEFTKQTEILTEAGLDHKKAYMLGLAQSTCQKSKVKELEDDNLLWYFKHSKQFSDTWGCAADDAMNKVCDDSTFAPNF